MLKEICLKHETSLPWLEKGVVYFVRRGSHAYGTNIATSDLDTQGIVIPPKKYFMGFLHHFEQAESKDPDTVLFNIVKFCKLASECNPNVIEALWVEEEDILFQNRFGKALRDNRDLFLSKRAKFTFSGYAVSQLNRIKLHRNYLLNPKENPPTREEFDLPPIPAVPKNQLETTFAMIRKQLDKWNEDFGEDLAPDQKLSVRTKLEQTLVELCIGTNEEFFAAGRLLGFEENFLHYINKEGRYRAALKEWDQYQNWLQTRNPQRAELEKKFGYDCYSDDTEFLTRTGWKHFDNITENDELATVFVRRGLYRNEVETHRTFLGVEYQKPIDRFEGRYSGPMYHLTGHHTDVFVTPNHKMLFRKIERHSERSFDWELEEVSALPDTFDVLVAPTPRLKNYSNKAIFQKLPISPRAFITLMGWYLSDGCMAKGVRVSQALDGKISWKMAEWQKNYGKQAQSSLYDYVREPNFFNPKYHTERLLDVRNSEIILLMKECGECSEKRIPRWAFGLSKYLQRYLLIALIEGDGTKREHKTASESWVYYSKSKLLADDVQELALLCGWETALWGPFEQTIDEKHTIKMYQVHLREVSERTRRFIRSQNIQKIPVIDQRIVCFTVPNGTLITRRNGKIGIHGNSKHALHLVRLIHTCKEILTLGKVIVKRPDAEMLLGIRSGMWSYEQLIGYVEEKEKELEGLYKTCTILPRAPDLNAIDHLCRNLVEEYQEDF